MRRVAVWLCIVSAFMVPASAGGQEGSGDLPAIPDAQQPEQGLLTGGPPEPHHLVQAERAGLRHVVDVRGQGEGEEWDAGPLVHELGMVHHRVPVGGPEDLDPAAVRAFDTVLDEIGDEGALVHCASGNRVGALFALRAGWVQGEDTEDALEIGRDHGLDGLEASVRDLLEGATPANLPR